MRKNTIGQRIITLRNSLEMSRETLCEQSELNIELLNRIEKDLHTPSISTLIRLSRALGVRVGTFLDDQLEVGPVLCKGGESNGDEMHSRDAKYDNDKVVYKPLASNKSSRHMEPFIIELQKGKNVSYQRSSHEGEEFIYVIEGSVYIEYGKQNYHLDKGESIYFDSIVEHQIYTEEESGAKVIANIYSPF
ncbi:cupin domain-containing protein [Halosquirtibacter laminarini]|uniref:Cupin domain-containing protein n=1 Tax=Halosquirtibacter laminarini TaxID=3374600 RepID=A0AC61NMK7_9BACT|nr:cupin domain-containing protein [Prolixibacteraceae bacterium]